MKKIEGALYRHDGRQWHLANIVICHCCGLEFSAMVKEIKKGGGKFCSRYCQRSTQARANAEANKTVGLSAKERAKQYRSKVSPIVLEAHKAIEKAIKNGVLIRMPCEKCGKLVVDGHHDDYEKPLDVRWLCRAHHLEVHRASGNWSLK